MYGALTVHGILAGPRLFTERADVAYTFMVGLMFTVVAMLIFGLVTIRWSSLMVRVSARFMVPSVLALSAIGTYGLRNSLVDVYVMIALGIIGYLFSKLDIPLVTIALGLVLGNLTEQTLPTGDDGGNRGRGIRMALFPEAPHRRHPDAGGPGGPHLGILQIIKEVLRPADAQRIRHDSWRAAPNQSACREHLIGLSSWPLAVFGLAEAQGFSNVALAPTSAAGAHSLGAIW
jgi:hypothetical protein